MSKDSTITSGLGLDEDYFDSLIETVNKNWKKCDTVSDLMLVSASEIKFEEFEVNDATLSDYEKKLVLLGMVVGLEKISRDIKSHQRSLISALFRDQSDKEDKEDSI